MRAAEVVVTWDLPTADLAEAAPNLRLIHIIGAGVEHLCPMDWVPEGVTVVNNRGAHADRAGEYGLMAVLMLHNRLPAIIANQRHARWESLYAKPIGGKTLLVNRYRAHRRRGGTALPGAGHAGARRDPARPPLGSGRRDAHHTIVSTLCSRRRASCSSRSRSPLTPAICSIHAGKCS